MLFETVLTMIPTNEPIKMWRSRESKWGARVDMTNFRSFNESRYIGEFESLKMILIKNDIGSNRRFALSFEILTLDFENIFLTSTIAFYFHLIEVDFRSSITS